MTFRRNETGQGGHHLTERDDTDPSALIDATLAGLDDWRGGQLARLRGLIALSGRQQCLPEGLERVSRDVDT